MSLGPSNVSPKTNKKSHVGAYAWLAAFLAVVGAIVCYMHRPSQTEQIITQRSTSRAIKEPDKLPVAVASTTNRQDEYVTAPTNAEKRLWLGMEVREHHVVTNNTLIVETFVTTDGKTHKYYHDERENILPSAADQILALMTAENDGFGAPPLPRMENFEDDFGKALLTEIVIDKNDSDEVKAIKERVIAARKELLDLMAQGISANDVVEEYRKTQEDNATIRFDAAMGVRELLDAGDVETAKDLCAKYNEVLRRANIMEIEIPEEYLSKEDKQ